MYNINKKEVDILLINSNALKIPLADSSVHCVVTSPPYFGLRDYQTARWEGGDPNCEHTVSGWNDNLKPYVERPERDGIKRQYCLRCGATRIDAQIGLEETLQDYIDNLITVFAEVWRVLRPDGTVWLNLGDSYAGNMSRASFGGRAEYGDEREGVFNRGGGNIKPKDKMLVPHRVAIALQEWGWWVRQDNVWWKNGMPESVRDRTTTTHEYVFQLAKSESYYYDYEAVLEPAAYDGRKDTLFKGSVKYDENTIERVGGERWPNKLETGRTGEKHSGYFNPDGSLRVVFDESGAPARNKRSVWKVATKPYPGAHYAVYPPELIEPCILAGCPEKVCEVCGKPWERVIEKGKPLEEWKRACGADKEGKYKGVSQKDYASAKAQDASETKARILEGMVERKTTGWQATCDCNAGTKPGIVLDPFVGSGTTCWTASKLGRRSIGLDLNFDYLTVNARERLNYGSFIPVEGGIQWRLDV